MSLRQDAVAAPAAAVAAPVGAAPLRPRLEEVLRVGAETGGCLGPNQKMQAAGDKPAAKFEVAGPSPAKTEQAKAKLVIFSKNEDKGVAVTTYKVYGKGGAYGYAVKTRRLAGTQQSSHVMIIHEVMINKQTESGYAIVFDELTDGNHQRIIVDYRPGKCMERSQFKTRESFDKVNMSREDFLSLMADFEAFAFRIAAKNAKK